MKFVNIEAVLSDLEASKKRFPDGTWTTDSIIELLNRYPKLEFDLADMKDPNVRSCVNCDGFGIDCGTCEVNDNDG